jgi:hypothetical protein
MLLYHNKITISRFISIRGPYVLSAHKAGTADARGLAVSCPARGFCRVGLLLDGSRPQGSWIVSEGCAESRHGGDGRRLRSSRLEPTQDCSGMPASTLLVIAAMYAYLICYCTHCISKHQKNVTWTATQPGSTSRQRWRIPAGSVALRRRRGGCGLWSPTTASASRVTATAAGEGVGDLRLVRPTGTKVCLVSRELALLPVPGLEAPDASLFFLNETGAYWLQHTVY